MSETAPVSPQAPQSRSLPALASRLWSAVAGLFGVAGVLYGAGFLALHSHLSFLGLWGGSTGDNSELAALGGKFLFDTLFALAAPVVDLVAASSAWVVLLAAAVGAFAVDVLRQTRRPHLSELGLRLRDAVTRRPTSAALLALALSYPLAETAWQLLLLDAAGACARLPALASTTGRSALYSRIALGLATLLVLAWCQYRWLWPRGGVVARALVVAQWALALGSLALLPAAYGRLLMPFAYPSFAAAELPPAAEFVLVGQTKDQWILWSPPLRRTEVIGKSGRASVNIGARRPVTAACTTPP